MMKTTADVPPKVASEYAGARRPSAVSQAIGDGYTKTKSMRQARAVPSSQYGLPKSGKKSITSKMG